MDGGQLVFAALVGGAMGFACGLIPFRAAMERKQSGLAIASMITCVLVGLIGGCILALPTAFVFKWIAVGIGEVKVEEHAGYPGFSGVSDTGYTPRRSSVDRERDEPAPKSPFTILGTAVVCNRCSKASSKVDGNPPKECPHCQSRFEKKSRVEPKPIPRARRERPEPSEEGLVPLERA